MQTNRRFQTLVLSPLLACCALFLSACGGGGGGPADHAAPVAVAKPTANLSRIGTVADQCGVAMLADLGRSGQIGLTTNRTTITDSEGYLDVVSYLASGDYFDTYARMDILLPLTDLRDPALQAAHTGDNVMGAAMTGPYLLGSIGCIKSVGKLKVLDDSGLPSSTTTTWASMDVASLPTDALLPKLPINGFEFLSNFEAQNLVAMFDVFIDTIHDPGNVDICRLDGASTWHCTRANAANNGLSYRFSAPMSGAGVYVLVAPVELD